MNAYDIIIKPVLTEKSYEVISGKTYVFIVDKKAGKTEIKKAIETIFDGVKVERVNTVNRLGKIKRQGRFEGRRPSTKKAYITLTKDSKTIEAFDNMAQ
ncbi:MAG: 50S ribosomal protein L23 [Clostridia bacterium]|nr:50S ribosomal protein L23 [Clostridia bacterium]